MDDRWGNVGKRLMVLVLMLVDVPGYYIVAWDITCDCNMGNSDMLVSLAIVGEAPFTLCLGNVISLVVCFQEVEA